MVNGNTGQWKLFEAVQDQTDDPDPTEKQTWNYWEADPRAWDGFVTMFALTQTRVCNLGDMHRMALRLQAVARPDLNSQGYVIEFGYRLREAGLCTPQELEEIWQLLHEYHGRKDDEIGFEREREQLEELEHLQPAPSQSYEEELEYLEPVTSQSYDDEYYEEVDQEALEGFELLQHGVQDFERLQQDVQGVEDLEAGPSRQRVQWERQQPEEPQQKRPRRG